VKLCFSGLWYGRGTVCEVRENSNMTGQYIIIEMAMQKRYSENWIPLAV